MTSIAFQIDPPAVGVLLGQPAGTYQRRREADRIAAQGNRRIQPDGGADGPLVEALSLLGGNHPNRPGAAPRLLHSNRLAQQPDF